MLPAHRVIGHREYGNTPPGGWAGRKTDPIYSMDWRRSRVANFKPQTTGGKDVLNNEDKEWLKDWVGWEAFATMPSGPDRGKRVVAGVQMRELYLRSQRAEEQLADLRKEVAALRTFVAEEVAKGTELAGEKLRQVLAEGYGLKLEPRDPR